MKKLWIFLIGIALGGMMGWALSFLRLPSITDKYSYWVGFFACLTLVSFVISLMYVRNKKLLRSTGGDKPANSDVLLKNRQTGWIFITLFLLLGGVGGGVVLYKRYESFTTQLGQQHKQIREQSEIIDALRSGKMTFLMSNVLEKIDDELKSESTGKLSDATITRVAALSFSLKPYRYIKGDTLSLKELSPERGQLLLALCALKIDSISFDKIKRSATFANADLHEANLKSADLSGINLDEADLRNANLQGANMIGASLAAADLWAANLSAANLSNSDLRSADLRWANMNGMNLRFSNLNTADLSNAKMKNADLQQASFQRAKLDGAVLTKTNLTLTDFYAASLKKAELSHARLNATRIRDANLSGVNLTGAEIVKLAVEETWYEKFNNWQLIGKEQINEQYKVVADTSVIFPPDKFFLEKIN